MKYYEPRAQNNNHDNHHFGCNHNHCPMSILKHVIQLMTFFFIGLPIALCLYIANEIYWAIKRLFK